MKRPAVLRRIEDRKPKHRGQIVVHDVLDEQWDIHGLDEPCWFCDLLDAERARQADPAGLREAAHEAVDAWDASVVNGDVEPAIEALRAALASPALADKYDITRKDDR